MNAPTATLTPEAEVTAGDLAVLNDQTKVALLTDEKAFEDLLDKMTVADACERFDLSADEFAAWDRRFRRHGRRGLAVRMLQEARL